MNKKIISIFFCLIFLFTFSNCGLDAFYEFYNIELHRVSMDLVRTATINLPSYEVRGYEERRDGGLFSNFIIFYRIYISDLNHTSEVLAEDIRLAISPALRTDYLSLNNYTIENITGETSNIDRMFYNRNYYKLEVENANIDNILGTSSRGKNLIIDFPTTTGEHPVLYFTNTEGVQEGEIYRLIRANQKPGSPQFFTLPEENRYFFNHVELYDNDNVANDKNADTAKNTKVNAEFEYTYAAMYIIARGRTLETPPKSIFTQATFIGVFRLPDAH